mmetsp:Transcript_11661/g.31895  ORF Transcript_11661/g.31895 Transcript_11661/m.31895 type:complete len:283 (-) Transcript_11661:1110-1958(-)
MVRAVQHPQLVEGVRQRKEPDASHEQRRHQARDQPGEGQQLPPHRLREVQLQEPKPGEQDHRHPKGCQVPETEEKDWHDASEAVVHIAPIEVGSGLPYLHIAGELQRLMKDVDAGACADEAVRQAHPFLLFAQADEPRLGDQQQQSYGAERELEDVNPDGPMPPNLIEQAAYGDVLEDEQPVVVRGAGAQGHQELRGDDVWHLADPDPHVPNRPPERQVGQLRVPRRRLVGGGVESPVLVGDIEGLELRGRVQEALHFFPACPRGEAEPRRKRMPAFALSRW